MKQQIQESAQKKEQQQDQAEESALIFKGNVHSNKRRRDSLDLFEKALDHGTVSMKAEQDEFLSDAPFVIADHSYMEKKYMEERKFAECRAPTSQKYASMLKSDRKSNPFFLCDQLYFLICRNKEPAVPGGRND